MGAPTSTTDLDGNAAQCLAGFAPTSVPSTGGRPGSGSSGSSGAVGARNFSWAAIVLAAFGVVGGAALVF